MAAIETRSLSKRYGSLHAVCDLDLTVERGEVFGLLGPNGAGKSTTIDVLLDFVRPTSGSVSVLGRDPQADPRGVRARVGTLPEAYGLYERSTARDHLRLAARLRGVDPDPDALLARVGLAGDGDRPVGGFSTGMRQRLGLAIALVGEPALLILDEPLGGLDPAGARLFRSIVRAERERGAAVLLSSHITTQVEVLCDRVGVMADGSLVAVDTVAGLRADAGATDALLATVAPDTLPAGGVDALDLPALDGVRAVERAGPTLRVDCVAPGGKAAAVARLDARGVDVRDLDVEAASLETLFLDLTGAGADAGRDADPGDGSGADAEVDADDADVGGDAAAPAGDDADDDAAGAGTDE